MSDLVPYNKIADMVKDRNEALAKFETAWAAIAEAQACITAATDSLRRASHGGTGRYSTHLTETRKTLFDAIKLPAAADFAAAAKRVTDTECWDALIAVSGLDMLMDAKAKDNLHKQLCWVPERNRRGDSLPIDPADSMAMPEISEATIEATLQKWSNDAGMVFSRGLANAFSRLDRRFRSHDGFKIGARVILTGVFSSYGSWSYGRGTEDAIIDIERVFAVLDKKPLGTRYASIVELVRAQRNIHEAHQSTTEGDYFRVKGYKNGNAHLWFTRDDLLEKVNKLLAEYYGEAIGDGYNGEPAKADPLEQRAMTPARNLGYFPTPDDVAKELFNTARIPLHRHPRPRVLEPSAGDGALSARALSLGADVDCCEIEASRAADLNRSGLYGRVYGQDFLVLSPDTTGLYDYVVMNPPFDRERDIDHVTHAFKFLKPGGSLTAVMSAGTVYRDTKKSIAFRAFAEKPSVKRWSGDFWTDLPPGSFASAGTYINTIIIKLYKEAPQS